MPPVASSFLWLVSWAAETLFGSMGIFCIIMNLQGYHRMAFPAAMFLIIALAFHAALNPKGSR
jgi:hypothetical protein